MTFKMNPISANTIPSGFNEMWNKTAQSRIGKIMTDAKGIALFNRSNAPVTISTILMIGENILVLAIAPKKAPASGPTSGIGANCKRPFNPKKSKKIPKII